MKLPAQETWEDGLVATTEFRTLPRKDIALILLGAIILGMTILAGEYLELPAAVAQPLGLVRLGLGLAYVLYVPGYCLTSALFPRTNDLDGIERNGLSLGLSVAWVPVLAFILHHLPWGLGLVPILVGQLVSIVAFAAVAVRRRERLPADEANAPDLAWRPSPWWRSLPSLDKRIYLLCAAALGVAGLAAAWIFLVPSADEIMTEFYILGPEGLAEDYPRQAALGETLSVTMGIANHEREPLTYRVEVWATDPWDNRRELVNMMSPFRLEPGEVTEKPVGWQMPWAGDDLQVDFYLMVEDGRENEPYRQLRLWLNVMD